MSSARVREINREVVYKLGLVREHANLAIENMNSGNLEEGKGHLDLARENYAKARIYWLTRGGKDTEISDDLGRLMGEVRDKMDRANRQLVSLRLGRGIGRKRPRED